MSREVADDSVLPIETDQTINVKDKENRKKKNEGGERDRDFLMVATTFIAAMAFQAGTNPPGGVWQERQQPELRTRQIHNGYEISFFIHQFHERRYGLFRMISDAVYSAVG
ncbi:hypothetical protein Csa_018923 [Cucumis sativus]|uniref:PGG domain-containing protein n=1 Tax=Cucumis sativus TaxID=3659 RepID=A0A0A0KDK4_CUCSA|nr:hypothetical protein Csa_018923 [Cucumis sativus]